MTFQRTIVGLLILVIVGLAVAFYLNWKTTTQLRTMKAFIEGSVFAEAVGACEGPRVQPRSNGIAGPKPRGTGLIRSKSTRTRTIPTYTLSPTTFSSITTPPRSKADIVSTF